MTRTISAFIASGFETAPGKPNTALEAANKLTLDDVEAELLGTVEKDEGPRENSNGSFEKFMMMMGNGGQRPGQ